MEKSQYSELWEFLVNRFDSVDNRLSRLENNQYKLFGELQDMRDEMTIGFNKTDNIEAWVIKASKKIRIPYRH